MSMKCYENLEGCYKSMSCELKCTVALGLINLVYFVLYLLDTNWLSFLMTKGILIVIAGILKVNLVGISHKT
jgi:hypothetical protein